MNEKDLKIKVEPEKQTKIRKTKSKNNWRICFKMKKLNFKKSECGRMTVKKRKNRGFCSALFGLEGA